NTQFLYILNAYTQVPLYYSISCSETFCYFLYAFGSYAAFLRTVMSEVPSQAATANAMPHTRARDALSVFKPLPAIPTRMPQITDKFRKVRPAVSHFMER